jgi:pimeloyl-ACP methyl ester carboxylesterase
VIRPPISRRRVYYISGFDPRGARFYHQLYAREAPLHARPRPLALRVGARVRLTPHFSTWDIHSECGQGASVRTDYQFLGWDDVVRRHWIKGRARLIVRSLPIYAAYFLRGGFSRVRRLSRSAFLSGVFPMAYLLLLGGGLVATFLGGRACAEAATGSLLVANLFGGALSWFLGRWGLVWAERLGVLWLLRTYVFLHLWRAGKIPEVDRRVEDMAEHILRTESEHPVEETLIVGHSVGTILAVWVSARVLEKLKNTKVNSGDEREREPAASSAEITGLQLLTLGQCLPLLVAMPNAEQMKEKLQNIHSKKHLHWTDVSALADPLCFFRTNPMHAFGVDCAEGLQPRLRAVRFFKMFLFQNYRRIRWNKVRLHFQYIMAAEIPTGYDYFASTAGNQCLEDSMSGME